MGLIIEEQETSISYMRDSDVCRVYTTDTTVMTRLDKLAKSAKAPLWKLVQEHRLKDGTLVGKTYETNKNLISFRRDLGTNSLSEEHRQARAERMRAYQQSKKQELEHES